MTISNMRLVFCLSAAVALATAATSFSAHATPVLEFSGGTVKGNGTNATSAGWSFTVNDAITVGALDAWSPGQQVRLYNSSGTTLASATPLSTDPLVGSPTLFYSSALATPVTLSPGATYYIVEDIPAHGSALGAVAAVNTSDAITYLSKIAGPELGTNPLSDSSPAGYALGIFGPNFEVVPEPAGLALLLGPLAGLAIFRRRSKSVGASAAVA